MKTLKLFNAVIAKGSKKEPFISEIGFVIEPNAMWAKESILDYYSECYLSGDEINKTFHKSWAFIKNSSRFELLMHQLQHYISTYGSNFSDEIYIPDEILEVPSDAPIIKDLEKLKLSFKVIRGLSKDELIKKCLELLQSGIALEEETIDDLIIALNDELDYTFTGNEGIKNKEAIVKIAELYGVLPENTIDFFRFIIYRTTGSSLLIKSKESCAEINESNFNPSQLFKTFGLKKLAAIFNRFKPLFLSFKNKCPKTINRISKLSKKYHVPLKSNPINEVTHRLLNENDIQSLKNTTTFNIFRALSACHNRMNGQDNFVYRIRNGKSYTKENKVLKDVVKSNYKFLINILKSKIDLSDLKIYFPTDIEYALPQSEKMFIGNIPTGTMFFGDKLAAGIYWENDWGANDLDLSGINIGGKVGWNSTYNQKEDLYFSGDITSAPKGAVEYVYANKGLYTPTLLMNNVYSGNANSGFNVIIGKGSDINKKYMMDPNNLFVNIKTITPQTQSILGIFIPELKRQKFVLLNFGSGNINVSGTSKINDVRLKALYQQWSEPLTLKKIVKLLGAKIVTQQNKSNLDLSINNLEKDTIINIFKNGK